MSSDQDLEPENTSAEDTCINCGKPEILAGYPNKLCADCRQKFIKYPIPTWVKLFGVGVAVIMIISMYWLPGNISAAISLAKSEKAEKSHKYLTEVRELEKAAKVAPNSIDVLSHMVIATFNNGDLEKFYFAVQKIEDKKIEDSAMYNKLEAILTESKSYMPADTFSKQFQKYKGNRIPDTAYLRYLHQNPSDVFATTALASSYIDKNNNHAADSLLSLVLSIDPNHHTALILKTIVKRSLNQPDSSIHYCDELIHMNQEDTYAMSSKARTLLMSRKNSEGLQLAKRVFALDPKMGYNLATLALAYHYNKDLHQRDELLSASVKDSMNNVYMQFVRDVISNKIKFQN